MNETPTHEADHRMAWSLIPWLVNGTIEERERREVERHLEACPDCRQQYALECRIRDGLQGQSEDRHDPRPALDDLLTRIEAERAGRAAADPGVRAARPRRWVRMLAAAAVVEAIGLAALGTALFDRAVLAPGPPSAYRTLTRAPAPAIRASIRLVPSTDMTVGELDALLAHAGVHTVEGHPARNLYALALDADDGRLSAAQRDQAVARAIQLLRADAHVRLAEPIGRAVPE